jgi:hypothetical protein
MPCNASYARFIFGKFFTSTIILYALLFAQIFFILCKKWVLHHFGFASDSERFLHPYCQAVVVKADPTLMMVSECKFSPIEGMILT